MPKRNIATTLAVEQRQYKNAELILCEFMSTQEYDIDEGKIPTYKDFNLQQLHDFIAERIDALDHYNNRYQWQRGNYPKEK